MAESPKANFDLTLPEGYENSSDDSKTSTYKERSPAKVPVPNMLPNSSSSDIPLEHRSKVLTYNREATKEMIDYPENEVKNIIEKIKLAKDSANTVEGYISKDTNFRSNKSRESFLFNTGATVCIIGLEVAKNQ